MIVPRGIQQTFEHCSLALPADQMIDPDSHGHSKSMPTNARLRIYGIRSKDPGEQDRPHLRGFPRRQRRREMTKDLGVWTADDCALVLIDCQNKMFEARAALTERVTV